MDLDITKLDDGGLLIVLNQDEREVEIISGDRQIYFVAREFNWRSAGCVATQEGISSLMGWVKGYKFTEDGLVLG